MADFRTPELVEVGAWRTVAACNEHADCANCFRFAGGRLEIEKSGSCEGASPKRRRACAKNQEWKLGEAGMGFRAHIVPRSSKRLRFGIQGLFRVRE